MNFDTSLLPEEREEILICGSGIAGLVCAITLAELGREPLLLTRGLGNTYYSQGGVACAFHPKDSTYLHFMDTVKAGRGLCHHQAVTTMVEEGVQRIGDLIRWGVTFDAETTTEGGHSFPRVLKVKDYTGRAIYQVLWKKVQELGIRVLRGELVEILGDDKVEGVLYVEDGSIRFLRVKAVVLATGGAASLYLHTSNPSPTRGDAIGIAIRKGIPLVNPEFVQFHPTVLDGTSFLISEAVRGEGATLIDERGERFVDELLPRDQVARAIYRKLKEGHRVFLDMRPIVGKGVNIEERFPTIVSYLREKGIDPLKDPIPVVPAAHYYIGGLEVDLWGRTRLPGLYAVGEVACTGVHGANRLASNSLLEGLVFGFRVAHRVLHDLSTLTFSSSSFRNMHEGKEEPPFTLTHLKELMWEYCGLERDEEGLKHAIGILTEWLHSWKSWRRTPENRALLDISLTALGTLQGALNRRESRGVHFRKDYPYQDDRYRKDTLISVGLNW
ncbi:L-aspartate oxidase [Thermocrinis albus DSM 14484]|uniref:L-aspartate oxidase n=1 Tax=Thermocrinis albus (strain DSM 14484 / JCM 11386 / HI 11/12) TaxID=638303 RepID=D3SNT4_THEAH|nr:L-aspartate oxidase [Thermocrinis albus]ADC88821.1 L-aspartate oxidase [Thermocrinis albus DSM 14484]